MVSAGWNLSGDYQKLNTVSFDAYDTRHIPYIRGPWREITNGNRKLSWYILKFG